MKILHYALGFPPYRSGGLTKFCVDLITQQIKEGHTVAMLWPGRMRVFNKKVTIKKSKVLFNEDAIQSFEIINPLPVSYDEGIKDIRAFTQKMEGDAYDFLLDDFKPDVIHIHTFMGIHKSFFLDAKKRNIRIVFTAHDFFPICPKVTLFRNERNCINAMTCTDCRLCNDTALSIKKIMILQSRIYRRIKDSFFVKILRKKHRRNFYQNRMKEECNYSKDGAEDYKKLRDYYGSMLKMVSVVHYNSTVTKSVYERFFDIKKSCIISITHGNIQNNCKVRDFSVTPLRIRYLGPGGGAKGYFMLKEGLDELWKLNQNFVLDIHFIPERIESYMSIHEKYTYNQLEKIFRNTDVLIVPSVWYETFGYTVLEALSYGVPVIVSDTVGAKDILACGAGIIIENISSRKICEVLIGMTREKLIAMNKVIVEKQKIKSISNMSIEIMEQCYK